MCPCAYVCEIMSGTLWSTAIKIFGRPKVAVQGVFKKGDSKKIVSMFLWDKNEKKGYLTAENENPPLRILIGEYISQTQTNIVTILEKVNNNENQVIFSFFF